MELKNPIVAAPAPEIDFDPKVLSRHSIKVVIQEAQTRLYWNALDVWTADIKCATEFRTCSAARERASKLSLPNTQLVLTRELKECAVILARRSGVILPLNGRN